MGELITKHEERESKVITGSVVDIFGKVDNPNTADLVMTFWFNQYSQERTVFSVAVTNVIYMPSGYITTKVQTDFNIYPYANLESFGGFNESHFANMSKIARQNCFQFTKQYLEQRGYTEDIIKNVHVVAYPEIMDAITKS